MVKYRRPSCVRVVGLVVALAALAAMPAAVRPAAARPADTPFESLDDTLDPMRAMIDRFAADRDNLARFYDTPMSEVGRERERAFFASWLETLGRVDFESLDLDGRVDYHLLRNELEYELRRLDHERAKEAEIASLIPFATPIVDWLDSRRRLEPLDAAVVAGALAELEDDIIDIHEKVEATLDEGDDEPAHVDRAAANRAANMIDRLRRGLKSWFEFRDGYDPMFTWWARAPYDKVDAALGEYRTLVRERVAGVDEDDADAIIGDPTGRDGLLSMLAYEMIPYTPEELIAIADREYAWCLAEMKRASRDLGFGDDWHAALEHVKTLHVEPGRQPELVRDLAHEAVAFLETRDLVTIPALCKETWRMEMMSPERQKVSPYFLGGEVVIVAFPTDAMVHEDKLMSLRGNNIHFARATVHHELIPGHHLQGFMMSRFRTHRAIFRTPFWIEGWALYWEMRLWDLDFPQSAENRVGMLFWRMHRCARIVFSLRFHLGEITPQEAIEYLIENVGHERNNATAEVRRSVGGDYSPLYQAAYMLGGLQIRALHREMVGSGTMTERQFHDAVLKQNAIPIELVRKGISGELPTRDFKSSWRFYD